MKSPDAVFQSRLLSYQRLTPENDTKHTYHAEIAWSCKHPYKAGDSVAIRPINRHQWIEPIVNKLYDVHDKHDLMNKLLHRVNVKQISGKLLRALIPYAPSHAIEEFEACLKDSSKLETLNERLEAWQLLEFFDFSVPQDVFINALMPLHPRFYSIASSPKEAQDRLALTIAHVHYQAPQNPNSERFGVCSDFLYRARLEPDQTFEAWIHPARDFFLAPREQDILMIGPGTGVAPFRAFMQERLHQKAEGALMGRSWLFFGERYSNCFFYESLWKKCTQELDFEVTCAFSREQSHKIYVQDLLWQNRQKVWDFIQNGTIYVCGDAKHMAKDVENTLMGIFEEEGLMSPQEAKEYLKRLRAEKRYLRDVY